MSLHTPVFVQPVAGDVNFPNGIPFSAQELRRNTQAALAVANRAIQSGVTSLDGQFAVTQHAGGANFSVDVAAGHAFVLGTDVAGQSVYGCWNDGVVNVVTPSPPASGTEVHRLVLQIEDRYSNGVWTGYTANLNLLADTGSGTPAQPASSITLALISIAAGQASVLNANITDQRPMLGKVTVFGTMTPGAPQTVSAQATLNGCTWYAVPGTYHLRGQVWWTDPATAGGGFTAGFAGPAASAAYMWGLFGNNGWGQQNNGLFGATVGGLTSNSPFAGVVEGYATFTAAGVLSLQASSTASPNVSVTRAVFEVEQVA